MRLLLTLAMAAHGLGMLGCMYFVFAERGWPLAFDRAGCVSRALVAAVWFVAGVAFVAAAWGLYNYAGWWRPALLVGATATLGSAALWAPGFPPAVWVGVAFSVGLLAWMTFPVAKGL